jgi:hypothetical protein
MRHTRSVRLVVLTLLLTVGLGTLPVSPVAAQNCTNIGPGAFLAGCDLSGMDLSGVNLSGANLRGANLIETNLDGANLSNARVTVGALDNANTSGTNLRGIRWIPIFDPVVTLSFAATGNPDFCVVQVGLTGFAPDTTYTVLFFFGGTIPAPNLTRTMTTGADGTAFGGLFSWVDGTTFVAEVDGVRSEALVSGC